MKNRNLSILKAFIFVMMAVCFFSNGTLKASAASEVKGLTQTRSEEDSVTVSWKSLKNAYGYDVFISSGNGKYKRLTNKTCDVVGSKNTKKKISNLTSSRTYYVVVKAVYKKENGKYKIGPAGKRLEVVTSPSKTAKSTIKQIKATPHYIRFKWDKVRGANRYIVYVNDKKKAVVKKNAVSIRVRTGSVNNVRVVPVKRSSSGFMAKGGNIEAYDFYSSPKRPKRVAAFRYNNLLWQPTESNTVTIGWTKAAGDKYDPTGYQMEVYSLEGRRLNLYYSTKTKLSINIPSVENKGFKVRVRAYVKINGKKYFGKWTDMQTVIPQAKISMKRTGRNSVEINWESVKNVTKYHVYACNDIKAEKPEWYEVATVGAGTNSYEYNNCIEGKYTAMYVIPEVQVGRNTYKASYTWHLYMNIE
ncbi:fibronectin type III domain-containing protein [Coprococcus eutactus]|uniref:Fibronectin type III domain-containing protein n=1 Tax=Coprococcus hominis (ex Liu et al. 2022) TaxID=2763039 RepID=A0A8I0AE83_9FIRM|nr:MULTISPECIES: fibronectin type III domain-containing protein [Clostridia]CCY60037.1 fibronectin type III domain protein [Clostridium sp. CAG:264]MBC5661454.1 fibronectin type III domain-containing protein [Coprococcus hominis (ex Liu et al. 2022)]MCB5504256.1 fibronectin type III domain-containing protein [Coprococcus eutactus]NSC96070.1 fibronectin type III domain-containing protein [Coprococcus eutactus]NSD34960.1 fibronectin type III domain-containing protein [Coprococcus eutactus]